MRLLATIPLALCLALPLSAPFPALAQQRPAASGVPSGPGGADPAIFRSPQLDPVSLIIAYNRMSGTTIDFRPFAETTTVYRNANTFDRADVLTREIARLEGLFSSLDLSRIYSMRLGTRIDQYDSARAGYPLALGADSFIQIQDPTFQRNYGIQFRNVDDINFMPVGDGTLARNFAQRHNLYTQGSSAGEAVLELAFRLVEVPPAIATGVTLVRADVVAARVSRNNAVIWDFGQTAAGRAPSPQPGTPGATPVLKAGDIQGIRVGMPRAEAVGIASRAYPQVGPGGEAGGRWYRALDTSVRSPRCGLDPLPAAEDIQANAMAALTGENGNRRAADVSEACLGFDTGMPGTPSGSVTRVTSGQRLAGSTPEAVRQALIEKYGTPTYQREAGKILQWIGRDPARPDAGQIAITAQLDARQGGGVLLAVDALMYVDPRPRQPSAPAAATAGPRL